MKKLNLTLVGIDGNAHMLLGSFQHQARKEGWTPEEIKAVIDEATSGNYDHLLSTLSERCVNDGFGTDEDEE